MNNPDHIFESLETTFGVKILKFFAADPGSGMEKFGSGMEKSRIRDKHPGSATLVEVVMGVKYHELQCRLPAASGPRAGDQKGGGRGLPGGGGRRARLQGLPRGALRPRAALPLPPPHVT
jgi:hypothetical protein